jgi:hypothetical protein
MKDKTMNGVKKLPSDYIYKKMQQEKFDRQRSFQNTIQARSQQSSVYPVILFK